MIREVCSHGWSNVDTANTLPSPHQGDRWDVEVTTQHWRVKWPFCFVFFSSWKAKTEQKAEMAVPTTTKVKVADFFQRLVCGLLIFFHSRWCFFPWRLLDSINHMTLTLGVVFTTSEWIDLVFGSNQPCLLGFLAHLSKTNPNPKALSANDCGEWKELEMFCPCTVLPKTRVMRSEQLLPCYWYKRLL